MIKGRKRSDLAAVTLLARGFLLLVGAVTYHQYGQDEHYQERLVVACAAKGGKLSLTNLCINMNPILDALTNRISSPPPLSLSLEQNAIRPKRFGKKPDQTSSAHMGSPHEYDLSNNTLKLAIQLSWWKATMVLSHD